jgi:hypothetical protein
VNTVTQVAGSPGLYRVTFPGLGTETGGNVQVTAQGPSSTRCKVVTWSPGAAELSVFVLCHDALGQRANSKFSVAYVRRKSHDPAATGGYLWATRPTESFYTPPLEYQWNVTGARNTVQRHGVGDYTATFTGVSFDEGTVEVTAAGGENTYCKVQWWGGGSVGVSCFGAGGEPADSMFTLLHTGGTTVGRSPNGTPAFHYAWAHDASAESYTLGPQYHFGNLAPQCASTDAMTMLHRTPGNYEATIPGFNEFGNVQVAAYGTSPDYCKVEGWWRSGDADTTVRVFCFDRFGAPVDSQFVLVYSSEANGC